MPLAPRTRLGPYEIVAPLGRGGMGEVYRARDTRLGRDVALKVLPSGTVSGEEDRLRFEREARTVSRLSHPNVCPLFDVGREGDTPFLVMELLEGETLAARLARGPLPLDAVLRHGAEIAAALAAAHARGIVHRDLKPANVMLTPTGARLMDFGLARAFSHAGEDTLAPTGEASLALTATGVVVGTVPYMAPEQIRGGTPDARTDLFALGAVLHEMATGVRAFGGSSEASVMSAVLTHEPPAISSLVPDTPPPLDRIVARCLAKDPAARWASAADLEFQLRELAGVTTASGRRSPVVPWRSRRLAAVVLGAVAVLANMTTLLFLRRSGPDVPAAPSARFRVWPPPGTSFWLNVECDFFAVSPDARAARRLRSATSRRRGPGSTRAGEAGATSSSAPFPIPPSIASRRMGAPRSPS